MYSKMKCGHSYINSNLVTGNSIFNLDIGNCLKCYLNKINLSFYMALKYKIFELVNDIYVIKSRKTWYIEYKKSLKCKKCGNADYRVIDFHHINPLQKMFTVSQLAMSGSIVSIIKEIKKCNPLCKNCHAIVEWEKVWKI